MLHGTICEMSNPYYGYKRIARFNPKNLETLRPCMVPLIGRVFNFDFAGTGASDEPYPGQHRWTFSLEHYGELPNDCKGKWSPNEDLDPVSEFDLMLAGTTKQ